MPIHPAPTSPKQQLENQRTAAFVQPVRTPWGRLFFLSLFLALLAAVGIILAWAWAQRTWPDLTVLRWLPNVTTTTIRERVSETTSSVPAAVAAVADSAVGLARRQDSPSFYDSADAIATLAPLSSSGWLLGRREVRPEEPTATLTAVGSPQDITQDVVDPASGFVFFKAKELPVSPLTTTTGPLTSGERIWIIQANIHQPIILTRRLSAPSGPRWLSSDQQEQWWMVDPPAPVVPGSLVVNDRGRLVGLMGVESKLWPIGVVDSALKQVFQQGTIDRPSLGLRYLDRRRVAVSNEETATGMLIGAEESAEAVAEGGPAARAGLKAGDIIVELDKQPVETDLYIGLRRYRPGQTVTIAYLRDGVRREATLELGTLRP